jgi:PhnB protein
MDKKVKAIPDGFHTLTTHLVMKDTKKAIDWYKKAFNAQEMSSMPGPGGKVMHAEIRIGDSVLMMNDEMIEMGGPKSAESAGGSPGNLMVYVDDCDAVFNKAVAAGAKAEMPLMDHFWGDRAGRVRDPFGYTWFIATHKEDVPPEEMPRRMQEAMAQMGKPQ